MNIVNLMNPVNIVNLMNPANPAKSHLRLVDLRFVTTLFAVWIVCGALSAQRRPDNADPGSRKNERIERMLRERSPEEAAKLKERLAELRELSPEKRRELLERARSLHETEKRVHRGAPEELRRELRRDPKKAPRVWRRHFEQELKDRGRRHAQKLPPEVRRRLRSATPGERVRILRGFQSKRMDIGRLGRELDLDPAEVKRLEALPREERMRAFVKLRRQLFEQIAKLNGVPKGLSQSEWRALRKLDDVEFFRQLRERGIHAKDFRPRGPRAERGGERSGDRNGGKGAERPTERRGPRRGAVGRSGKR